MSAIDESSVGDQELFNGNMNFTIPQTGYEEQVWTNTGLEEPANNITSAPNPFEIPMTTAFDANMDPYQFGGGINIPRNPHTGSFSQYPAPPPSLPSSFTTGFEGMGIDSNNLPQDDLPEMSNMFSTFSALQDLTSADFFDNMPDETNYTHARHEI